MDKQPDVNALTKEVIASADFKQMMNYLFETEKQSEIYKSLEDVKEVIDFQRIFSKHAVQSVLDKSSAGMTYSGAENIDPEKPYVFIANHRDIVLDSAMMQCVLFRENLKTTYVVIGDNLMFTPFVGQLCALNKIFAIARGGGRLEKYKNAIKNSERIRSILTEKKESVWIAQRNGRTKDGCDKTQSAVLKMLNGRNKNYIESFRELNIIPVTVSYEIEPCDAQKISELYHTSEGEYVKAPGEDYKSVMSGIVDYKGRIHMQFGKPVNEMLESFDPETDLNTIADAVENYVDAQIYQSYRLWPANYYAYDVKNGTDKYTNEYNDEQVKLFEEHIQSRHVDKKISFEKFKALMIDMYAMPVANMEMTK